MRLVNSDEKYFKADTDTCIEMTKRLDWARMRTDVNTAMSILEFVAKEMIEGRCPKGPALDLIVPCLNHLADMFDKVNESCSEDIRSK